MHWWSKKGVPVGVILETKDQFGVILNLFSTTESALEKFYIIVRIFLNE